MVISRKRFRKRRKSDKIFYQLAKGSTIFCIAILVIILSSIIIKSFGAFNSSYVVIETKKYLNDNKDLDIDHVLLNCFENPELASFVKTIISKREIGKINNLKTTRKIYLKLTSKYDQYIRNNIKTHINENDITYINELAKKDAISVNLNFDFFINTDSREPEKAGALVGIIGSLMTVLISMIIAVPIGIITAIYLEEIAKRSWIHELIEVNIANLASIPSIIYGILGLSIFIIIFNLPRSSSLIAGLTLGLMVLPIIVVSTRQALRTIPNNIRDAAMGLGASKLQTIIHHLIPLSLPGIMTGIILSIARVMGEAAPLLMLGMVAYMANIPESVFEPATVLPIQIYLWATSIESGYIEKTFAAILMLLIISIFLNFIAFWVRKKYERIW
ncbi:MAG: phosphate ABC transporter permease PstA [Sphingobacteriia bacterium]|nr:phosphate ABC transporter permease PstA [Sphingobacteriia bacterium]